jgi:hypothetical protein
MWHRDREEWSQYMEKIVTEALLKSRTVFGYSAERAVGEQS